MSDRAYNYEFVLGPGDAQASSSNVIVLKDGRFVTAYNGRDGVVATLLTKDGTVEKTVTVFAHTENTFANPLTDGLVPLADGGLP